MQNSELEQQVRTLEAPKNIVFRRNGVEIGDGLVFKRGDAAGLELEAFTMERARAIGQRSGLFAVPNLVELDLTQGRLVTEFVPGLKNLYELAEERHPMTDAVYAQAGRALATVHRELRLPQEKIRPLPGYLLTGSEDNVALHGDFCWCNVCWQPAQQQLVLLDWASTPVLEGLANFGSRYFDLLWFSWSLFYWTPPRQVWRWRPEALTRELLRGYAEREKDFRWAGYIRLRSSMRPLLWHYRRKQQQRIPSRPLVDWVHWFGWLRWRLFPLGGAGETIREQNTNT